MDSSHHASLPSPARNGEDNRYSIHPDLPQESPIPSDNSPDSVERKRAAEQLQFQAAILGYITDSVIVSDLQGTIIYWNEGASAVFGYTAGEMIGKSTSLLSPELDVTQNTDRFKRILAGQDYMGEWQGRRKDGTPVWIDVKTTILRDMQGTAIGLIGIAKDITGRKEAEERLRQSE